MPTNAKDVPIRVDMCRRLTSDTRDYKILLNVAGDTTDFPIVPRDLRRIARDLVDRLDLHDGPDFVVGLAPGGIALAVAVAYEADLPAVIAYKCRLDLPNEATWIEPHAANGIFYFYGAAPGMRVVLIDDEADMGATLCNAVVALRTKGVTVVDVGCAVESVRGDHRIARDALSDLGIELKSVYEHDREALV